jgi:hypothetical protein
MTAICFLFASGSYDILNLPQDARSLALNNTTSAYNGTFLQNNPAAISADSGTMSYSYSYLPANIHLGSIQNINKINKGVRASKISILNYGTVVNSETKKKSYAFDALVELGYKKELKKILSVGISGGYLFSSITGYNSQLMYSKVGVRCRLLRKKMGIGISLENMGIILKKYTDVKEPLPTLFRAAIYYQPKYIPLVLNIDIINKLNENTIFISNGFEFYFEKGFTFYIGSRLTQKNIEETFENLITEYVGRLSAGIGVNYAKTSLDFGFQNLKSSGYVLAFTLKQRSD